MTKEQIHSEIIQMKNILTIPEYGRQKNISRQAVHDAIKNNRLSVVELPVFVEFEGRKIEIEKRKFVVEKLEMSG